MKWRTKRFVLVTITTVMLVCVAAAQEKKDDASSGGSSEEERGQIEFGFRTFWGSVYGRPDLPFKPDLGTSKLNEYSDIRNNLFLRRAYIRLDDILGANNYLNYQTKGSFYKNQSHLVTAGQFGKFKAQ